MNCHLVTIEVSVERGANQRVQLNSLTLNQLRLKRLNTETVQGRCTVLLPVFQLLGTAYRKKSIVSRLLPGRDAFDSFTKIDFLYADAVASVKVGKGVKSEGELIVSGTKAYIYVPAPWWKTDYFEVRYENPADNARYFYQLDGEGIRYEIVAFLKAIKTGKSSEYITQEVSNAICGVMEDFCSRKDFTELL